jgi:hypothetical protein
MPLLPIMGENCEKIIDFMLVQLLWVVWLAQPVQVRWANFKPFIGLLAILSLMVSADHLNHPGEKRFVDLSGMLSDGFISTGLVTMIFTSLADRKIF